MYLSDKPYLSSKPKGLHPEDSKLLKEQSLDRTIQTDREADKEGQVCILLCLYFQFQFFN